MRFGLRFPLTTPPFNDDRYLHSAPPPGRRPRLPVVVKWGVRGTSPGSVLMATPVWLARRGDACVEGALLSADDGEGEDRRAGEGTDPMLHPRLRLGSQPSGCRVGKGLFLAINALNKRQNPHNLVRTLETQCSPVQRPPPVSYGMSWSLDTGGYRYGSKLDIIAGGNGALDPQTSVVPTERLARWPPPAPRTSSPLR